MSTNRVELSLDLVPGVAIVDQILALVDRDGNGRVSDREVKAYGRRALKDLRLLLDETPLTLHLTSASFPRHHEVREGLGVIRIRASASMKALNAGDHRLHLKNNHLPELSVYMVNALVPKDPRIRIGRQIRDELQQEYRLEFRVDRPSP